MNAIPARSYHIDVFRTQFPLVDRFAEHLAMHRAMKQEVSIEIFNKSALLVRTSDAHLLQAVIYWCMVFGTDENQTQWKKLWPIPDAAREEFRQRLGKATGRSEAEWDTYWEEIVFFRNNYAAHRALGDYNRPVPSLKFAEEVAFFWDRWVRDKIAPDTVSIPLLQHEAERYHKIAIAEVRQILSAMKGEDYPPFIE